MHVQPYELNRFHESKLLTMWSQVHQWHCATVIFSLLPLMLVWKF